MGSDPAAEAAARVIAELTGVPRHDAFVVMGSGWSGAAEALGDAVARVAFTDVPGLVPPTAEGHPGTLLSCAVDGHAVLCFLGRTHLYEGHGVGAVTLAIRAAAAAGCRLGVLTNANGSLRPDWPVGTPMLIADHLDLSYAAGWRAPAPSRPGPPVWSARLRKLARECDAELVEGVYALLPGPHYETAAEARMVRLLGADVLGMSTVAEACAAHSLGVELLGLSLVTAVEIDGGPIDPSAVVAAAERSARRLGRVIRTVLSKALSSSRPLTVARESS